MARPIKQGLDYFPLDVDIDQDDKIEMVEAEHGHVGFSVVIRLLAKIYKEGYFYEWSERERKLFAKRVNVDINTLESIVSDCINERIFNKTLFEAHGILTSKGIQKRYLEAVKRRKQVVFKKEYFLVDDVASIVGSNKIAVFIEDADENKVNVNINHVDGDKKKPGKVQPEKGHTLEIVPEKPSKKPATKLVKFTAEDMDNARYLFDLIQRNNPDAKEPSFDKWADVFRLMREKDGRTDDALKYVIDWSQANEFWRNNILSPSKLRDQWVRLTGIIRTEHEKNKRQLAIGQNQNTGDIFGGVEID